MFTAHGSEQLRALQPRAALRDRTQASVARRVAVKGTISLRMARFFNVKFGKLRKVRGFW